MSKEVFTQAKDLSQVYLVGGAVRDKLLCIDSTDNDYVVVGETVENILALGYLPVGADFPVFLHPKTKEEYALARTERKVGVGYAGFVTEADTSVTLEQDLARRDLTINSIAMDSSGQLIDPYNGQQDLKQKILRHTTDAFAEDPVRVLRVARFLARFGPEWTIHPSTVDLMKSMHRAGELQHLVAERVWKEMEKALMEPHPSLFFKTLIDFDLFPELQAMQSVPQPKQHHPEGDVFIHTMLVVQRAADLKFDLMTRFAALTHDFGKPIAYEQQGNLHGHEALGMSVIDAFCERLRVPNKLKAIGTLMSENHTKCHKIKELKPATIHRFMVEKMNALKQPERFLQFVNACICDSQGRGPTLVNRPYPQAQLALGYLAALQAMDNKQIIKEAISLGKTGVELGEYLRNAQIDCLRNTYLA